MKTKMKSVKLILTMFAILSIMSYLVLAEPYGADSVTVQSSERANLSIGASAQSVTAEAGNVTLLEINTSLITKRWQGYYGNLSGTITLQDASGNVFYDWSATGSTGFSPTGTIFAANDSSIIWANVSCVNFDGDGTSEGINLTQLETKYGMSSTDADGFDETFSGINNVDIGSRTLTGCNATNVYTNSSSLTGRWNETLLTQNATVNSIIFATQVESNLYGFNNNTWDFQMIVAEADSVTVDAYYFYVELS
jgi:hypothetical protein